MIEFNKSLLLKTAKLSAIKLTNKEIQKLEKNLKEILKHFEELNNIKITNESKATRNINVFRQDEALKQNYSDILEIAPKTKDNYFVVPPML